MRVIIIRNNVLLSAVVSGEDLAYSWTDVPGKYVPPRRRIDNGYGELTDPNDGTKPTSLLACKSLCEAQPSCLAVDYMNDQRTCYNYSTLVPHDHLQVNSHYTHSSKNEKGMAFVH